MKSNEFVTFEVKDRIAWITLNRPDKRNALSPELIKELHDELNSAVILITHNAHHAFAVGDTFTILQRGRSSEAFEKDKLSFDQLLTHMAGGAELERLAGGFTITHSA